MSVVILCAMVLGAGGFLAEAASTAARSAGCEELVSTVNCCSFAPRLANGNSPGGNRPTVVCRPLVLVRLLALPPPPGSVSLVHGVLAPGLDDYLTPAAGPSILYVDRGAAILEWESEAPAPEIRRGGLNVTPSPVAPVTNSRHAAARIEMWDWVMLPAGFPHVLVGAGSEPATLLRVEITATEPAALPVASSAPAQSGAAWTVMAQGTFSLLPPVPALLAVARVSYDAAAADARLIQNMGPLLTAVESGSFVYLTAMGSSAIVRADTGRPEPVPPGIEASLQTGDFVIEQPGVASGLRNLNSTPSFVVMVGLSPMLVEDNQVGSPEPSVP
jgi:hypothetical protein